MMKKTLSPEQAAARLNQAGNVIAHAKLTLISPSAAAGHQA